MISSLEGSVQSVGDDQLVVEVGGIGLQLAVPLARLDVVPRVGGKIFLHTYLNVREDALELYGFGDADQRRLFQLLLKVNGVGPRLAMATLAHMAPDAVRRAVATDQPELMTKVPGIGRKTAEKIVFDLKDEFERLDVEPEAATEMDTELLDVLTGLGYSVVEAQAAVQSLPDDTPDDMEERVRLALRYFAQA